MKEKHCGNCKHFKNEDVNGKGWCEHFERSFYCFEISCKAHCLPNNGWTEITPDNMEEAYNTQKDRLVIAWMQDGMTVCRILQDMSSTISTMAKIGGYYYMELPGLKLDGTE